MSHLRNLAGKTSTWHPWSIRQWLPLSLASSYQRKKANFCMKISTLFNFLTAIATYSGNADSLNVVLDRYLSLNSTSFIRAETHVKGKNHKRFSQEGKPTFQL